tara:strand:+ start:48 stop:488 length:441 start_codon:yes stop_codon:yes gene_type:complete
MANTKRIEKRLQKVEDWAKAFEKETGPRQTMENMNWLVGQTRLLGDRLNQSEQGVQELQNALNSNSQVLNAFLEQHDMVRDWQMFLEGLQAEQEEQLEDENNAVQESGSEEMDAQEQADDGEGMGEGASEGDQDTEESQEEANKEE